MTFGPIAGVARATAWVAVKRGIEASTTVNVQFEQVRDVFADDPGGVVSGSVTPDDRRDRRFRSELGVALGAGGELRQAVDIEVGGLIVSEGLAALPLWWQASGRDRLFPVFDGRLEAMPAGTAATRLVVRGTYVVPLGPVGRFGDGLVGRRLARQSLTAFLEDAAGRIDAEVHRRTASVGWRPAPYPVALQEREVEVDTPRP